MITPVSSGPAPRSQDLSLRQRKIWTYLFEQTRTTGIQPSLRDLCHHFQIKSPHGVYTHLIALEKKGWIALNHRRNGIRSPSRSVRFLKNLDGSSFQGWN